MGVWFRDEGVQGAKFCGSSWCDGGLGLHWVQDLRLSWAQALSLSHF